MFSPCKLHLAATFPFQSKSQVLAQKGNKISYITKKPNKKKKPKPTNVFLPS